MARKHKTGGYKGKPALELFIRKIVIPSDKDQCWEWPGPYDKDGYGKCSQGRAHKYSYSVFRGEVPPGLLVCHACDNRKCVNPSHLWIGTSAENTADRNRKGRQARQHRIRPTITVDQALEMRNLLQCGMTVRDAALKYGVSPGLCSNVKRGVSWHFRDE